VYSIVFFYFSHFQCRQCFMFLVSKVWQKRFLKIITINREHQWSVFTRTRDNVSTFKSHLDTHLFLLSYRWRHLTCAAEAQCNVVRRPCADSHHVSASYESSLYYHCHYNANNHYYHYHNKLTLASGQHVQTFGIPHTNLTVASSADNVECVSTVANTGDSTVMFHFRLQPTTTVMSRQCCEDARSNLQLPITLFNCPSSYQLSAAKPP